VVPLAYNFQTGNIKIKMFIEYESVTQEVLFDNALLTSLMSGINYGVISENGDCSRLSELGFSSC
jgi:hypothetical protein